MRLSSPWPLAHPEARDKMAPEIVQLKTGESALFGYGSLISKASLEKTLGRKYTGPFIVCELEGWRRSWDVAMPNNKPDQPTYEETPSGRMYPDNILYLNVRSITGSLVNGVLFVVNSEELDEFDKREWIYKREDVTSQLHGAIVENGPAYVYVAKPEYVMTNVASPAQAAVRRNYLKHLETGFHDLGETFRIAFEASSDPVPLHLVIADKK
jgi:cation transport regulator ChaC